MKQGFMYLVAIIDVFSRFVVGWSISNTMHSEWVVDTFHTAIISYGKCEIINSDQGSQFTCKQWVEFVKSQQILISMDGKGRAIDNVYIERLWRTVKYEYLYLNPPEDGWQLYEGLTSFFEEYNFSKYHQGIGRNTPASRFYPVNKQPVFN